MIHLDNLGPAHLYRLTSSIALALFLTFGAASAQSSNSIGSALNPNGTLRANVSNGSFSTKGYQMVLSKNGTPRFVKVSSDPTDVNWDGSFTVPGVGGQLITAAVDGNYLYVGGQFGTVGNVIAHNIAKYDMTTDTWSAFDSAGVGTNGPVYSIIVNGSDIYVGGNFTTAGSVTANAIAKWNSTSGWSALGAGTNNTVTALLFSGGSLYAAGSFTQAGGNPANRIAKWNSTSGWSALGTGLNGAADFGLVVAGGYLYVGGTFLTAGGTVVHNIAKWNGTTWSALGSGTVGTNNSVLDIAVSGDTALYVVGTFTQAGGTAASHVAKYSIASDSWSALGGGLNGSAATVAVDSTNIYVGGGFTTAGIISANNIARWNMNSSSWSAMGDGVNNVVYSIMISAGKLYAGGFFTQAGKGSAYGVASWDGTNWSALSTSGGSGSVGGNVFAIAVRGDTVFVGGNFPSAGTSQAQNIAIWDRTTGQWSALDNTSTLEGVNEPVYSILPTAGGDVYVGGAFTMAGNVNANHIVKWNPIGGWSALGTGTDTTVYGMTMIGTNLYVCGLFTHAGGNVAHYAAQWNGTTWSALGSGLSGIGRAIALAGGQIYVGGDFTLAGGSAVNYIASWNGSNWSALGSTAGTDDPVYAIAVQGDSVLYVGGTFANAGGSPASGIAKYSIATDSWSALSGGLGSSNDVRSIAVKGDTVYTGGFFTTAGLLTANYIAVWNTTSKSWSALGSGTDGGVLAVATGANSDVYAGGAFTLAGDKPSYNFARYNPNLTAVSEPVKTPRTFALMQNYPNPFNPSTVISYQLSAVSHVTIRVYDILGRSVATLVDGVQSPGLHSVVFDGARFASGVYFYRMQTGTYVVTRKMVLMK